MRRLAVLTAATALTAALAPAPLAGAATSEATFNHRVNAACRTTKAQLDRLGASSEKDIDKRVVRMVKIVHRMQARLEKIEAPAERKATYRTLLALNRQSNELIEQGIAAARAHHVEQGANLLFKGIKASQKVADVATDLDLGDCVTNFYPGVGDSANAG